MSKFKFILTNAFLWLGVLSSALLIENVGFLTADPVGPLSDTYFYMLLSIVLLSYIALFVFEHWFNKTGFDFVLLGICGILLGSGLAAIWIFKDMSFFYNGIDHELSYSTHTLIRFSISYGVFIVTLYSILFIFSKNHITARYISWIFVIFVLVGLYATVYSFIAESESYKELFELGDSSKEIKSLFWNTNMFSGMLIMGMCSAIILNIFKKSVFSYLSLIVFFIEILLTCSVLSVIIGTTLFFAYFLIEIIVAWKKTPKRSFVFLGLYLAFIVALVCLFAAALDDKLGPLSKIFIHVYEEGLRINVETFSNRKIIWVSSVGLLQQDPLHYIFGYGFGINRDVINGYLSQIHNSQQTISSTHNGILQILFNYGLVGISIYALFFVYFIYALIRLFKHNKRFAVGYLFTGIALLAYSIGESVIFFNSNVQGLLVGTLFYLPAIMKYKHQKHRQVINSVKLIPYSTSNLDTKSVIKLVATILISGIVATSCLFFMEQIRVKPFVFEIVLTIYIGLWILLLTLPYLVGLWHKNTKYKHFRIRATLNSLFIVLLMGGIVYFYFFFTKFEDYQTYKIVFPVALAAIMLVEILYYSVVKKGSFKLYLSTFVAFKTCLGGIIASCAIIFPLLYVFSTKLDAGYLKYILIATTTLLVFYIFTFAIRFKDTSKIINYVNDRFINYLHSSVLKDEMMDV